MCEEYKHVDELAKDNPGGLDTLPSPINFSNNPGFVSTGDMLSSAAPGNGETGTIRTAGAGGRGILPTFSGTPAKRISPNPTLGRSAMGGPGSIAHPAPGSTDPGQDGSPIGRTSGYGG
jgi:hypothetical protein